ncbi:TetR/AcrR family transcriptional regulator [Endozoicomonas sp.]|uniref:TetR/AcrR family transcriptional regulator n=1 Tax=Endozoicomonas sp. TaxID=1892382 RepID=UPI003D9B54BB
MKERTPKYDQRYLAAVDAAAAVFAEKGYHAAGTIDIAERLNIKQGSLYYYFRSKEAALEAVCLEGIRHQISYLQSVMDGENSFAEAIQKLVIYTLSSLEERSDYMIVFDRHRQVIPLEKRGNIRDQSNTYHKLLEDMFEQACQKGELKPGQDIHISVRAFTGLLSSASSWYQMKQSIDLKVVAKQYSDVFLFGSCAV